MSPARSTPNPRRSALEKSVEAGFRKLCARHGFVCEKLKRQGKKGFPDRSVFRPRGRIAFVELKRIRNGRQTECTALQLRCHRELREMGFEVHVIASMAEAHELVARWLLGD